MTWLTFLALFCAFAMSLAAGFVFRTSLLLGLVLFVLAGIVIYLNLPMALVLKRFPLNRRPLPRAALQFWLAAFSALNLPRAALIQLNNRVTGNLAVKPEAVHVLISRCLQYSQCPHRVTEDINNCRECGRCKIGEIKRICQARGLTVTVESGGTSARQRLHECRPKLVVAAACERELLSGILDTRLPVVGVMIIPGPRPCTDSDIDIADFEAKIYSVLKEV